MRILSMAFICYLLLMMAGPCCMLSIYERHTTDACCDKAPEQKQTETVCSPFYACSACTGFTVQTGLRFEIITGICQQFIAIETVIIPSAGATSIWQPPKMT